MTSALSLTGSTPCLEALSTATSRSLLGWLGREVAWPMPRRLVVGATTLIALTSAAAAVAALRHSSRVEPYVWVQNPIGSSATASQIWHTLLATLFASGAILALWRAAVRPLRTGVAISIGLIALLAARDAAVFYHLIRSDRIESGINFPLSLIILAISGALAWFVWRGNRTTRTLNIPLVGDLMGCGVGAWGLILVHLITFGTTDYRRTADVAVILGAKVYSDGSPSLSLYDRLCTGIELYQCGHVRYLLMTGGTGVEGYNEAAAMREFALNAGVADDHILMDPQGINTMASARNVRAILDERNLESTLLVSHYFHLARCKMLFSDQGIRCATVPAHMSRRLSLEVYFVLRECVAYITYSLERPFDSSQPL